jgi:hypothetical protein
MLLLKYNMSWVKKRRIEPKKRYSIAGSSYMSNTIPPSLEENGIKSFTILDLMNVANYISEEPNNRPRVSSIPYGEGQEINKKLIELRHHMHPTVMQHRTSYDEYELCGVCPACVLMFGSRKRRKSISRKRRKSISRKRRKSISRKRRRRRRRSYKKKLN